MMEIAKTGRKKYECKTWDDSEIKFIMMLKVNALCVIWLTKYNKLTIASFPGCIDIIWWRNWAWGECSGGTEWCRHPQAGWSHLPYRQSWKIHWGKELSLLCVCVMRTNNWLCCEGSVAWEDWSFLPKS